MGEQWCLRCEKGMGVCTCTPTAPDPVGEVRMMQLTSVWTEQPGIQLGVDEHKGGVDIVAVDNDGSRIVEIARYTVSLEGRRRSLGCAIMPQRDREEFGQLATLRAENERLRAEMHGCQDGALVRDLKAQVERLRADIAVLSPDAATTTLVQRVYKYRTALVQARKEIVTWSIGERGLAKAIAIIDAALKP